MFMYSICNITYRGIKKIAEIECVPSTLYHAKNSTAKVAFKFEFTVGEKYRFWCSHYFPMRPRERICELQWSGAADAGRSHDNDNMANVVCPNISSFSYILLRSWSRFKFNHRTYFRQYALIYLILILTEMILEKIDKKYIHIFREQYKRKI